MPSTYTADCNFTETDTMALTAIFEFLCRIGKVHTLAIDIGDVTSDSLDLMTKNRRSNTIIVHAPDAFDGTVTAQVSLDGTNYVPLQSAGSNIVLTALKGTIIPVLPPCHLRFVSSVAEDPAREIFVLAIPTTGV